MKTLEIFLQSQTRHPVRNIQNNDLKQGLTGSLGRFAFFVKLSKWYILYNFFKP